jgi:hypothetical protein
MANVLFDIAVRRVLIYLLFAPQHVALAYDTPPADTYHVENVHSHFFQALK